MKKILALFTVALSSILFMQQSVSQVMVGAHTSEETIRSVSYLGIRNDMLVFEVSLHFNDNEMKTLSIFDEAGNEIYTERIRTNKFAKQYMFAKNSAKLQFKLRGKKQILDETFQISYKTEEKIEITKA